MIQCPRCPDLCESLVQFAEHFEASHPEERPRYDRWTGEEDAIVRMVPKFLSAPEAAELLGRTKVAVSLRVSNIRKAAKS